jgi:hypothetical protein
MFAAGLLLMVAGLAMLLYAAVGYPRTGRWERMAVVLIVAGMVILLVGGIRGG